RRRQLDVSLARHRLEQVTLFRTRERNEELAVRALEPAIAGCRALDRLGVEALVAVGALDLEARLLLYVRHGARVAERVLPSDWLPRILSMEENVLRRGVAEFIGTFTLIFIGGGAGIVSGQDIVAVALANGLAIGIMVTNLGHISGGHFNPAITLGFVATRRITLPLAVAYWISQFAGAIVAAAILRGLFSHAAFLGSVPHAAAFGAGKGLVVEIILTFFLVWAVFATAVDPRGAFKSIAGLAIGLTITIDVLMGGPLTGAAMNPARAFGPELLGNFWGEGWIYYLGPPIGALIAAMGYEYLYLRPLQPAVVGTPESGVDEPRPGDTALD
ncbi:MAG: aquaporin, partial [Gaiellaceae bacterium]|nr:aquaporin [Gaiellaceae bacterium]